MVGDDASEYVFRKVGDGVFERKCYGLEELTCNIAEYCDGFGHFTVSALLSLTTLHIRNELSLEECVRAAWTAFRHFTPAIACKVFRYAEGDKRFAFRYIVPQAREDVEAWLDETIIFDAKRKEGKTFYEQHCELKNGRWWRGSDNRYAAELHVLPFGDEWHFSLSASHNSIDGGIAFAMLELFLEFLKRESESEASPTSVLDWGSEVVRLPPPGAFIKGLIERGTLPDISTPSTVLQSNEEPATSSIIPWTFATRPTNETGDVTRLIHFSEETTAKLHAACRRNGKVIMQVVTALTALAHVETVLAYAGQPGSERSDEVLSTFRNATHYLIPLNPVNKRSAMPGGYDSLRSSTSTPLCLADNVPLMFPMRGIKNCIRINEEMPTVTRVVDENAFWNELVPDIADTWKAVDLSLDSYASRELSLHHSFNTFTPKMIDLPLLLISSIRGLGRPGLLSAFVPAPPSSHQTLRQRAEYGPEKTKEQTITVHDVICGIRVRIPPIMNILWEYNGRIACHFMTGGEYMTSEELASLTRRFEEWTEKIVG